MNEHRLDKTRERLLSAMGFTPAMVVLSLAGCGMDGEAGSLDVADFNEDLANAPVLDQAPPPGALVLQADTTLHSGQYQQARVSGLVPLSDVYLLVADAAGPGPCPLLLGGTCVDVQAPVQVVGTGAANSAGLAIVDYALPYKVPDGATVYLQAVGPRAGPGDTSNVVTATSVSPARACGDHPWLMWTNVHTDDQFLACAPIPASGVCPEASTMSYAQGDQLFRIATGRAPQFRGGGWDVDVVCDEISVETACCFGVELYEWAVGRPFRLHGTARIASCEVGPGWAQALPVDVSGLSRRNRRRLAAAWQRTAQGEHASVAAFARFVLQLVQLGAPADLVADATTAMGDEVRHAQAAFGIASAFAGEILGAGPMATGGALDSVDVASVVLDAVREGCIAETIAACQAAEARDACVDPVIRAVLVSIADDEARHAELSWRFVRWALNRYPEVCDAVAAVFAEGLQAVPVVVDPMADTLRAHGALCEAEMQAVAARVHVGVVLPCARALLGREVGVGLAA